MISIKQSDIDRMKEDATEKGCKLAFGLMLAVPAMVIHDHYGELMKKDGRVEKFVDLCMEEYKCYEEGYVRLDEMAKILKEEANIEVDCW